MLIIAPLMILTMLLIAAVFVAAVGFIVYRLAPADPWRTASRWVLPAAVKGLAFPFLLWVGFNSGFLGVIQPLMPSVQVACWHSIWSPDLATHSPSSLPSADR